MIKEKCHRSAIKRTPKKHPFYRMLFGKREQKRTIINGV